MSSKVTGRGKRGRRLGRWAPAPILALLAALIGGCAWGVTRPAENVGLTSATVTGVVTADGDATATYWFEYGPTKGYGSETTHLSIDLNGGETRSVSEDLTGLNPESKYHFRLCATDPGGTQPQKACGNDYTFETGSGPSQLAISTDPALYPDFDPDVPDYVTHCENGPVDVNVEAPVDTEVSVDGGPDRNGTFTETVPLGSEQAFSFSTQTDVGTSTYHVRCLPNNFPDWTFDKYGPEQRKWYMVAVGKYAIIFDGNGVPVWWRADPDTPNDFKLLADGTLAASSGGTKYEIRNLDGDLLNTLQTVGSTLDSHDMLLLPNGDYMLMTYRPRPNPTDLTPYGGTADGIVLDAELQEVKPDGTVVWTWNSKDHISLDETGHWWDDFAIPRSKNNQFDVFHMNAVDLDGDSIVISLRHTDAIYEIDPDTGDIVWKLGGTPTPESLTVLNDPHAAYPLGGQHDVRILSDGTLTAHDNGELQGRPPRTVHYAIDKGAGTATLLDSLSDPDVPAAVCCGSARLSPSGSWLVSWGGLGTTDHPVVEYKPDGSRTFVLDFPGTFSYRAVPVPAGKLGRGELRVGMDHQHPR